MMGGKKYLFQTLVLGLVFYNKTTTGKNQRKVIETSEISTPSETNGRKDTNGNVVGNNDQSNEVTRNKIAIDKIALLNENEKAERIDSIEVTIEVKDNLYFDYDVVIKKTNGVNKINIAKRSADEKVNKENITNGINITEVCIGEPRYCNLSREVYEQMLWNYIYPHSFEWVLIFTHTVVFIAGLFGNTLVCVVVYKNHSMKTVTNYFIVNLAVADFMVLLFCLPPTVVWDVTESWFLGEMMCKVILYFQSVSVTVSVLTLTFISVDRWYAICYPLKFKSTTGRAKVAIMVIWTFSLTFNAPELFILTTEPTPLRFELQYLVQCIATWSEKADLIWHIVKIFLIYTAPLMLMTIAYYQITKVLWRTNKIPGQLGTPTLTTAERCKFKTSRNT